MTLVFQINYFSFVAADKKRILKFCVYIQIPQRLWDKLTTMIK